MKVNQKDYAFLRAVLKLDSEQENMNTSEVRSLTDNTDTESETISDVIQLSNNDVNNKLAKFGSGNSQVAGREMIETLGKDKEYAGRGSKPKLLRLKDERREEVKSLLEEFNPTKGVEGFESVQEAINFYISTSEETRQTVENNKEMLQEMGASFKTTNEDIAKLQEQMEELQEQVDENTEALETLRDNVRPLVLGMVEELEEKMGFEPEDYL